MKNNKTKLIQIFDTSKEEFLEEIKNILDQKLKEFLQQKQKKGITLLSRKSTAKYFGITTMTLDSWCRKGLLKSYRKGSRRYFRLNELEESLTEIKHK